jgi:hypothetical protein
MQGAVICSLCKVSYQPLGKHYRLIRLADLIGGVLEPFSQREYGTVEDSISRIYCYDWYIQERKLRDGDIALFDWYIDGYDANGKPRHHAEITALPIRLLCFLQAEVPSYVDSLAGLLKAEIPSKSMSFVMRCIALARRQIALLERIYR